MKKIKHKVLNKKIEAPNVATLELSVPTGGLNYIPGQFIDIYFLELGTSQGKSYSISSAPSENKFCITVKAIGDFSNRLFNMKKGDFFTSSEPYGFFFSESENSHLVMLGGGIGVAPFRATINEQLLKNPERKMSLFYSSRTEEDIIFKEDMNFWKNSNPNLFVKHFITREEHVAPGRKSGRMTAQDVLKEISNVKNAEFLICGSIAFVRDMRKSLLASGVSEGVIYTEAFFSH